MEINPKELKKLIEDDAKSEAKANMTTAENYYLCKNDICKRKITYKVDGVEYVDGTKSNYKIAHAFFKILIDQKVNYLLGKPVKIDELLNEDEIEMLHEMTLQWAKKASIKGIEWIHVYKNSEGNFDYMLIPAQEIIATYDKTGKKLETIIRYYKYNDKMQVEVWDDKEVKYYVENKNGQLELDAEESGLHNKSDSWDRIPFIKLQNNFEDMSDLDQVKSLIDAFDINMSDFTNNLADLQDIVYILKNYEGESLQDFILDLKAKKAISVDENGGVDTLRAEIPFEARIQHLKELKDDIFIFGQGVNPAIEKIQNPSGVMLEFLYSLLDLKCDALEIQVRKALRQFLWFYFKFKGTEHKTNNIVINFNRNMLMNTEEALDNCIKSLQLNSKETMLEKNPFVNDVKYELERISKEGQNNSEESK